ncbi:TetR/AcrR family transcriptional regulator [Nocardia bovistercoris]|uniref:TetR/AcrR family transcriptional regulator n=1 Tax=Nocardia bovistercoris TaxID=2785916 RepID=A0A931I6R6_9NOCA|nr:TetR/AcrR family transcriptional regulator [Nocardia bovistercoris]
MAGRRGWGGDPPSSDEEATRRIVAAAVELIGRTGTEISIADVAESLGVIRQTVYRYFPSSDALMQAAAYAAVDGFLDQLAEHVSGNTDPADAMTEAVLFTLTQVRRIPHLGLMLSSTYSNAHPEEVASERAHLFGMAMLDRFDVDWRGHGFDDRAQHELVEYTLRTMQSFFISPGTRTEAEQRHYLRRWLGAAIRAQAATVPSGGAT